jgi:hypothetical protein
MRASIAMNSKRRARGEGRRGKTSIALLTAFLTLAGAAQALAPTQAAAVISETSSGGCTAFPDLALPEGKGLNANGLCDLNNGAPGGASGGDGSQVIGEPIYVEGSLPKGCSLLKPWLCAGRAGGGSRPLGFADDGGKPAREPRAGGRGTKGENPKSKGEAERRCQKIQEAARQGRLIEPYPGRINAIDRKSQEITSQWRPRIDEYWELDQKERDVLSRLKELRADPKQENTDEVVALEATFLNLRKREKPLHDLLLAKVQSQLDDLGAERKRAYEEGMLATLRALARCGEEPMHRAP